MNFYRFINSKDIRAHLEKIGYAFSPLEAAWLVYQNRTATLKEKHAAWQEIISAQPDCTVDRRQWCAPEKRLHPFLCDYMALERKWLKAFYENDHAVYQFKLFGKDEGKAYEDESKCVFSGAEACFEAAKKEGAEIEDLTIRMTKRTLDSEEEYRYMELCCRRDGEVLSVDFWGCENERESDLHHAFDMLWFVFPVPFEKGDILWDPARGDDGDGVCSGPVVMENATPGYYAETGHEGYDASDMNVWGYFQYPDGTVYNEVTWNYMDFEYYPPERLTGKRRILKALGNFMKGKIDEGLFARAYHQILAEEHAKESMPVEYLEEGLRLAGLKED